MNNEIMKLLAYPLTILYYLAFFVCLGVFHIVQWLGLKVGGYKGHKMAVDVMNFCLVKCINILGTSFSVSGRENIPEDVPLIFVCNHQSMFDISPLSWFFRKHHPKFISKIELGKGIPSVSFNLNHGGSVLIDRKDAKQSLRAILGFGKYIEKNKFTAVIFPEGTRSKDGKSRAFKNNGLKMLVRTAPSAYVVPITINNSWKIEQYGGFPLGIGTKFKLQVHLPIQVKSMEFDALFERVKNTVIQSVEN